MRAHPEIRLSKKSDCCIVRFYLHTIKYNKCLRIIVSGFSNCPVLLLLETLSEFEMETVPQSHIQNFEIPLDVQESDPHQSSKNLDGKILL